MKLVLPLVLANKFEYAPELGKRVITVKGSNN